jgi:hypothetical protein
MHLPKHPPILPRSCTISMKEGFKDAPATCLRLDSMLKTSGVFLGASHQKAVNVGLLDQIRALVLVGHVSHQVDPDPVVGVILKYLKLVLK